MKAENLMASIFLVIVLVAAAFFSQAYANDMNDDTSIPLANRYVISQIPLTLVIAAIISTLVLLYKVAKG